MDKPQSDATPELIAQSQDGAVQVYYFPNLLGGYVLFRNGKPSSSSNKPDDPLALLADYENWKQHTVSSGA